MQSYANFIFSFHSRFLNYKMQMKSAISSTLHRFGSLAVKIFVTFWVKFFLSWNLVEPTRPRHTFYGPVSIRLRYDLIVFFCSLVLFDFQNLDSGQNPGAGLTKHKMSEWEDEKGKTRFKAEMKESLRHRSGFSFQNINLSDSVLRRSAPNGAHWA